MCRHLLLETSEGSIPAHDHQVGLRPEALLMLDKAGEEAGRGMRGRGAASTAMRDANDASRETTGPVAA